MLLDRFLLRRWKFVTREAIAFDRVAIVKTNKNTKARKVDGELELKLFKRTDRFLFLFNRAAKSSNGFVSRGFDCFVQFSMKVLSAKFNETR